MGNEQRAPGRVLRALRGEDLRPAARERPWVRWLLFGVACAMLGAALGFGLSVAFVDWRLEQMERRLIPPGKVYEHGEPVRR